MTTSDSTQQDLLDGLGALERQGEELSSALTRLLAPATLTALATQGAAAPAAVADIDEAALLAAARRAAQSLRGLDAHLPELRASARP